MRAIRRDGRPALAAGVAAVLLALPLAGCFGSKDLDARCNDVSEYQASRDVAPVVAPPNLKLPAQTSGYGVPPDPGKAADGAACLARPPRYFRDAPATPGQPAPAPGRPAAAPAPPAT